MAKPFLRKSVVGVRGVPDYDLITFNLKKHSCALYVFVINEGHRIQNQLRELTMFSNTVDIYVADGGSTDGSLEEDFLKSAGVSALLTKRGLGGLSAQMRMGFHHAIDLGYKSVIVMDGNGKDGVEAISEFVKFLSNGFDHVQGSRFVSGGRHENTPISRYLALKFLHAPLVSWASGVKQTDTTNGFRGYSCKLLTDKKVDVFREVFQTYELHYHLAIEAGRSSDFRCIEIPVSRVYPKNTKTPTKISPIRGNLLLLMVLLRAVAGKYRIR